jgi:hypothetical protein
MELPSGQLSPSLLDRTRNHARYGLAAHLTRQDQLDGRPVV